MIPRGEVGMAVAQLGLAAGIIAHGVYSAVVLVAVATTLLAPPLMKLAFRGASANSIADEDFRIG
jgi:Kef-type K+ transport system membrane component KefB